MQIHTKVKKKLYVNIKTRIGTVRKKLQHKKSNTVELRQIAL